MWILAQVDLPIPEVDKVLNASDNFIINQGVAVFALVIFAFVIFGMMAIIIMMLRYMVRESKQQDKIINNNVQTLAQMNKQSDAQSGLENKFSEFIAMQTKENIEKRNIISEGIASIDANTAMTVKTDESVNTMKDELVKLTDVTEAVRKAVAELASNGVILSTDAHDAIVTSVVKSLSSEIEEIKVCIETAIRTTQETPAIAPDDSKPETKETKGKTE